MVTVVNSASATARRRSPAAPFIGPGLGHGQHLTRDRDRDTGFGEFGAGQALTLPASMSLRASQLRRHVSEMFRLAAT